MRRKDREIPDMSEILAVMGRCSVCRVAFFDETYPYIVPLNFGIESDGDRVTLYFHCATEGKKLELLKRCDKVGFEADIPAQLIEGEKACYSTMLFESVCGNGTLEVVPDGDKIPALKLLMRQYSDRRAFDFDHFEVKAVTVLKLTVNEITGKRLRQE
jgi:nitroimidazol reductase NimA-like FMN-containing flavoprotein (pyridoxamine 5'-phosphate oxidase superfamily)